MGRCGRRQLDTPTFWEIYMSASSLGNCPQLAALDSALAHLPWSDVKRVAIHLHHSLTLSVLDQIEEDNTKAAEAAHLLHGPVAQK